MTPPQFPGENERRPAGNGAADSQGGADKSTVVAGSEYASLIRSAHPELVRGFDELAPSTSRLPGVTPTPLARRILGAAPRPIPRYGDREWLSLPTDDLRRFAAILIGAECWREYCSVAQVIEDLRRQLAEEDRQAVRRLGAASREVALTGLIAHDPAHEHQMHARTKPAAWAAEPEPWPRDQQGQVA